MLNPSEFIEDFMAMGHPYEEAVAMAREELSLRRQIGRRSNAEQAVKAAKGEERPPVLHFWQGGYRGKGREVKA